MAADVLPSCFRYGFYSPKPLQSAAAFVFTAAGTMSLLGSRRMLFTTPALIQMPVHPLLRPLHKPVQVADLMGDKQYKHPCPDPFMDCLTPKLIAHQEKQRYPPRFCMIPFQGKTHTGLHPTAVNPHILQRHNHTEPLH